MHQGSREEDEVVAGRRGAVEHGGGISVLPEVSTFKYLGRVLTASVEECPEMVANFREARRQWE